ncbi:MAG: prepilin-type N-terminal cleavage/methylation domain-containing protein [Acidobacteriota bacterium]
MKRSRQPRGEKGFSLLEMIVSLAVLAIALSITSRLLLESQLRLAHSAERALDPESTLALKQIRADIRAASVVYGDSQWSWESLRLGGHPAGALRYERMGTDLVRRLGGSLGQPTTDRTVLRNVTVWRWRISSAAPLQLVEIELGHRETPRLGSRAAGGERVAVVPITRRHRVAASPRRAAGKNGW